MRLKLMKLKFEKVSTNPYSAYYIHVEIAAVRKDEERIGYAVQNMAYSLGYNLVKKEE